jgi:gliding motility-associated-like protein
MAGPDQFFCSPETQAALSGNSPLPPALGEWSIISGSGEISDINDPSATVSNLGLGENILIWQIYNGSCPNSLSTDTLSIFVNDSGVADADAGPDQFFCGEVDETQLEGSETIGNTATGMWTIIEGGGDFVNIENEFTFVSNIPLGVNTYVWTVDNLECGISSDTVSIFVYDPDIDEPFAGDGVEICENEFEPFELNAVEPDFPAIGFWTVLEGPAQLSDDLDPNAEVINLGSAPPLGSEVSVLAWNIDNGVCGVLSDTLSLSLDDCLTIEIPDAFSPNGDLINDFWEVPNLFSYPNNTVKIFNRWGALVYEASPYLNDWDGRSDHPSSIGEELPVSTYYYILDLGDGTEPFTGYIYLKR